MLLLWKPKVCKSNISKTSLPTAWQCIIIIKNDKCTSLVQDRPAMFHKQSNDAKMLYWINIALVWQTTPWQDLELQIPTMPWIFKINYQLLILLASHRCKFFEAKQLQYNVLQCYNYPTKAFWSSSTSHGWKVVRRQQDSEQLVKRLAAHESLESSSIQTQSTEHTRQWGENFSCSWNLEEEIQIL